MLTGPPLTAPPTATSAQVATLLVHQDASAVLVVDGGRAVGVVTKRDVLMAFYASLPPEAPVTALMTTPPVTVPASTPLRTALAEMQTRKVAHLVVVDEGGLPLGVASMRQVLSALDRRALARAEAGREAAEQAQRSTDALLAAVFQQGTALLALVAIDGTLLRVNDAALEVLGATREEVVGQPFADTPWWTHDVAQQERLRLAIADVFAGRSSRFEAHHPTRDGHSVHVDFSLVPITDDSGAVVAALAQGFDLTARKQAELLLRRSEFNARQLFEGSQAVMLLVDPETGRVLDANRAAVEWYGWPRDVLLGLHIHDINTQTLEEVRREMQAARDERRTHFFFRHRLAGGAVRDVEVHSGPLTRDGQTVLYSIIHDITTRRQAERQAQLFRTAVDQSPVALLITDLEARIIYANRAMEQLGGWRASELLGKTPRVFRSLDTPRVVHQELWQALVRDGRWTGELRNRRKDGGSYWERLTVTAAHAPDGATTHYIAVKEDVTTHRERSLRLSRLEDVFLGAGQGLAVVDAEGMIREANGALCTRLGQRPEQVPGQPFTTLFGSPPAGDPGPLSRAEMEGSWQGPVTLPGGAEWLSVSAVRDGAGLLQSFLLVLTPREA